MRPDQATDLRKLVLHSARGFGVHDAPPPRVIVAAGGKGGVGTTTAAVHLATALARDGRRVVLVDANFASPDVAQLCGCDDAYGAIDVLSGNRTVHEVFERGPLGVQVLPTARGRADADVCTPQAQDRLISQLAALGAHADYVIIDAGSGSRRAMRRFWEAADVVLIVTHPDSVAVMDAYAVVKLVVGDERPGAMLLTLANCVTDAAAADEVHARLDRACRRFLGFEVGSAGFVPFDPSVPRAAAERRATTLDAGSAAGEAFERLAFELPRRLDASATFASRRDRLKTSVG